MAVRLYGQLLGARTLDEAAHCLVAELPHWLPAHRVSVGLRQGGRTRVLAVSGLDERRAQAELPALLAGAMDEALEQGVAMVEPPPADAPDLIHLGQALLRRANGGGGSVLTLPLGQDGEPLGALCLERHRGRAFSLQDAARLGPLLALALPLLALLARAEEPLPQRLRWQAGQGWRRLRSPQQRASRWLLAGAAALLLALAAWPLPQAVSGRARIEGAQQRVLVAPTDGFVKAAHARPGDRVAQGAPLVDLMEQDLALERERWSSQLQQHEAAYAGALAKADRGAAAQAAARAAEAQAQLGLLDGQLGRARLTAPFDGVVIDGDLSRSIGAPVRQGDALVTLAAGDAFRVIVEVDETDIAQVQPGQSGRLRLSGGAWSGHPVQVARVATLARAVDGRNVFEVEARLLAPPPRLRPGLLGQAELVVGRQPPLWTGLARLAHRLRLAWWRWTG